MMKCFWTLSLAWGLNKVASPTVALVLSPYICPIRPPITHQRQRIALLSTTENASSSSSSSSSSDAASIRNKGPSPQTVVYQQVVRPSAPQQDFEFLGSLVSCLQDEMELPLDQLPMVYEQIVHDEAHDDDINVKKEKNRAILSWHSPLSPDPIATTMHVEVVAIYPDVDDDEQTTTSGNTAASSSLNGCTMAMVVVTKDRQAAEAVQRLPPMFKNLFADSEKRILQGLDRALQDFAIDTLSSPPSTRRNGASTTTSTTKSSSKQSTFEQGRDDVIAELLEEGLAQSDPVPSKSSSSSSSSSSPTNAVMDAEIISSRSPTNDDAVTATRKRRQEQQAAAWQSMKQQSDTENHASSVDNNNKSNNALVGDFAVHAAKRAALESQSQGFAVSAAKRAAAAKARQNKEGVVTNDNQSVVDNDMKKRTTPAERDSGTDEMQVTRMTEEKEMISSQRPPSLDQNNRSVFQTISRPQDFQKRRRQTANQRQKKEFSKTPAEHVGDKLNQNTETGKAKAPSSPPTPIERDPIISDTELNISKEETRTGKRKINIAAEEVRSPEDDEIMRTAQEALAEMAEQGKEMSAEELLDDVMKFGDEADREDSVGSGFVSGAFEKAKDLLREQKGQRDERLRQKVVDKAAAEVMAPDFASPETTFPQTKTLTEEEELRRMFEAGERLAESRITVKEGMTSPGAMASTGTTEKDVDQLIAGEKDISDYARVLDDELVELEIRINKSPNEDLDGPRKNPIFDVLSGPETYNPNVDPLSAVNWPGALPGSKEVRLPKELDEALKQAEFAANVLTNVIEKDEQGEKVFSVGKRQLTQEDIDGLRTVVTEAVELGLIDDPLTVLAERSRLQLVLDELWDQPEERFRDIAENYKDLLLSDNFVQLIKERLNTMTDLDLASLDTGDHTLEAKHKREREIQILGQLVVYAQLLLKEARALGAELEAQQIEVIRSICKVAMDPSHQTEEETAMALTDAVRDMRPLFDDAFVAYLKYAVAEEEGKLAREGVLDDPDHNQWLFVLKIVQQGVYAEIAKGINRYIEHILYVLRMETAKERRMLLEKLIDDMPTLDVRPFVRVVDNIVGALGDSARGEFDGLTALGEMTNKLLQLHRDVKELMPPERIAKMSRDADEWAASRREKMLQQRGETKKRIEAARETEHLDSDIEALGRRGEMERF